MRLFTTCTSSISILVFLFLSTTVKASSNPRQNSTAPLITLPYGTFRGAYSPTYNLTYYRSIPFGASTAGANRFRAPQPPEPINGVYDTDRAFDMCPQRTVNGSEDCLYLGIYSRPWKRSRNTKTLRPVLLTFYGGGFMQGSATFTIPPPGFPILNVSDTNDYVVVYSNYRTNVFGFLPGSKIHRNPGTDLNPGLLDQRAALKWIQAHIHHFGGDKNDVTIFGQSAGGGSVLAQTISSTGKDEKPLFKKALMTSPFWPKTYRYDDPESEDIYNTVVKETGCSAPPSHSDSGEQDHEYEINCLKSTDVQTLRDISRAISESHTYTTSSYTWAPVITSSNSSLLSTPLSSILTNPSPLSAPSVFTSYNLHEGTNFIPPSFQTTTGTPYNSSSASFDAWLAGFLPRFSSHELAELRTLYPATGTAEEIVWNTTYERAGMLYRDLVLACPAYWLAEKAQEGYLTLYTIEPARHASDTVYWNTPNPLQASDPLTYLAYTGAMASYISTSSPNTHKLTNASIPAVPRIQHKTRGSALQFLVTASGPRQGSIQILSSRCEFWLRNARKVPF